MTLANLDIFVQFGDIVLITMRAAMLPVVQMIQLVIPKTKFAFENHFVRAMPIVSQKKNAILIFKFASRVGNVASEMS
jgi:hypothetical protein